MLPTVVNIYLYMSPRFLVNVGKYIHLGMIAQQRAKHPCSGGGYSLESAPPWDGYQSVRKSCKQHIYGDVYGYLYELLIQIDVSDLQA